jgi:uncharacterized protein (DUF1778 family)
MNKEDSITFRATKEEKELILKKAKEAGMKMSDYVRTCSLAGTKYKITTITEIEEINE